MITQLHNNKILLVLGGLLLAYGLIKPDLSAIFNGGSDVVVNNQDFVVEVPQDPALKEACDKVVQILRTGPSSRKTDGMKLSSLYYDLANLISLDNDDQVVKSTLEIREANRISGSMFRLKLGNKYENLADAANGVIVAGLGDNDVVLDENTRKRAVETFKALSWACYEGSK